MNQQEVLQIALRQSAEDCCCAPESFLAAENGFFISRKTAQARRYLELPHLCNLVSYGTNIVVTGKEALLPEVKRFIDRSPTIESCFETPGIYRLNQVLAGVDAEACFMADYFLPDLAEIQRFEPSCGCEMALLEPEEFSTLYLPEWSNALCKKRKHLDVLAVGAYDYGELVGLAGCSADCETMWQIGIDVLPAFRRRGIASALTNRLARETLRRGRVPFYCAAWSNVKSVRNAIKSGFRPAWVEITAKKKDFIAGMMPAAE